MFNKGLLNSKFFAGEPNRQLLSKIELLNVDNNMSHFDIYSSNLSPKFHLLPEVPGYESCPGVNQGVSRDCLHTTFVLKICMHLMLIVMEGTILLLSTTYNETLSSCDPGSIPVVLIKSRVNPNNANCS